MIAADSSAMISYMAGEKSAVVNAVAEAIKSQQLMLPPAVLAELLSDVKIPAAIESALLQLPLLEITTGYWQRVGKNRAKLLSKGFKARLADTLIAQSCIDARCFFITADKDFRHYAKHCGLQLM